VEFNVHGVNGERGVTGKFSFGSRPIVVFGTNKLYISPSRIMTIFYSFNISLRSSVQMMHILLDMLLTQEMLQFKVVG
jgi:hypothetical protein